MGNDIPSDLEIKQTATALNPAAAKFTVGQQYAMVQDQQRRTVAQANLAESRSFTAGLIKEKQDYEDKQLADKRANDKKLRDEYATSADPDIVEKQILQRQEFSDKQKADRRDMEANVWDVQRQEHADKAKERDIQFSEAQRVARDALEARDREARLKAEQALAALHPPRPPRFTKKQQAALDALEQ